MVTLKCRTPCGCVSLYHDLSVRPRFPVVVAHCKSDVHASAFRVAGLKRGRDKTLALYHFKDDVVGIWDGGVAFEKP